MNSPCVTSEADDDDSRANAEANVSKEFDVT